MIKKCAKESCDVEFTPRCVGTTSEQRYCSRKCKGSANHRKAYNDRYRLEHLEVMREREREYKRCKRAALKTQAQEGEN